jgi:trehalose 6-phosphate synthase
MSRLIVISNRVSAPRADDPKGAQGGFPWRLRRRFGNIAGMWFGWSGNRTETFTGDIHFQRHEGVTTATIDLEEQDVDEYYNGYANRTLWPLFHYRVDLPSSTEASEAATRGSTSALPKPSLR